MAALKLFFDDVGVGTQRERERGGGRDRQTDRQTETDRQKETDQN